MHMNRFAGRVPLIYRVLIANSAIVALAALIGTVLSSSLADEPKDGSIGLIVLFVSSVGIGMCLLVNTLLLKAAFRPLISLNETALAVQRGNVSARAATAPGDDPEMKQLALTLNQTLDDLARDQRRVRELSSQVIRAQEEERRRISRELHDDTAQMLFAQLLQISALKMSSDGATHTLAEALEENTVDAIEGVRRLALELRPPALDDLGLHDALDELCARFEAKGGFTVSFSIVGPRVRMPENVTLVIYRITQEALTNIDKHAHAARVTVSLTRADRIVELKVIDDGCGFERSKLTRSNDVGLGLGLFGMEERATLIGGTVRIISAPGKGTEVIATIPLEDPTSG